MKHVRGGSSETPRAGASPSGRRSQEWVDYERVAPLYEEGRALPAHVLARWGEAVRPYLPSVTRRVLDLGAGTGIFARASAVSQHVARLERELGIVLLSRGPHGVHPTAAGRLLFAAASAGEAALSMAVREIARLRAGTGGELSISTGGTTVRHFMREAVRLFRERRPGVALRFEAASSTPHCVQLVLENRADLAFVTHVAEFPGIQQRPVLEMPLLLLVASGDPLARRRSVELRDLATIRYVSLAASSANQRFSWLTGLVLIGTLGIGTLAFLLPMRGLHRRLRGRRHGALTVVARPAARLRRPV